MKIPLVLISMTLIACGARSGQEPVDMGSARPEAFQKWQSEGDYYALLEIVDAHLHPFNHRATKADVLRLIGPGMDDPEQYPNAGPRMWIYSSLRRAPYGSSLTIIFDEADRVIEMDWASE